MRLIDADEFKMQAGAAAISNGLAESARKANVIMDLIDMQPTAYDVEKLVNQLEEWKNDKDTGYIVRETLENVIKMVKTQLAEEE